MGTIKVNIESVLSSGSYAKKAQTQVKNTKNKVHIISNQIDSKILSRNEISGRFNSIENQLILIDKKIERIINTSEKGVNNYYATDLRLKTNFLKLKTNRQIPNNSANASAFKQKKETKIDKDKIAANSYKAIKVNYKKTTKKIKNSYNSHGKWYSIIEYGKSGVKIVKGVVKIVGSVAIISTGAGIPIAVVGIISAGNDIINGLNNIAYVETKQYEDVGEHNYLKDLLIDDGKYIGKEILNDEKTGEKIGKWVYTGIDMVEFLDGTDKMLKSFGKVNTVLTDTETYSPVWGEATFDDVLDNKIKFNLEPDYFVRKFMKVNPSSTGNLIYESTKNVYKAGKKAYKLGDAFAENIE